MGRLDQDQIQNIMRAMDCFTWVSDNNLELGHGPWELKGHEYQVAWLQEDAPEQCFIKGAQIGATECLVLRTLHGLIHGKYPQGAMYLFPTRDDVGDFSQTRFDPLIGGNPFIGMHVSGTDRKNVKKIGRGHLLLRGARVTKTIGTKKSSSQLKSAPADRVVFDELDEMDPSMITLAKERISHSPLKQQWGDREVRGELMYLGTPTIPDFGIDKLYQTSDQRVWMIQCHGCGKESSLDLEFPNSLKRRLDGTAYRRCIYCDHELYPRDGRWRAQYEGKSDTLVGWWISQLNSIYVDPTVILDLYEDPPHGDLSEVMNSKLGRAYIPAENRLHPNEVYACCGKDPALNKHEGPTCMGVDVGTTLHVVIAERTTRKSLKIIKLARVSSFNDLHDLARDFNVRSAVIDLFPEKRKVVEFQKAETFSTFGCTYVETRTGQIVWDEKDRIIKANRTEVCDMSHDIVATGLALPRRNDEVDQFVREMCNMAKVLEEDEDKMARTYRYKKLGPDHYRHAMNYCILAADRCPTISDKKLISRFRLRRKRKSWLTA